MIRPRRLNGLPGAALALLFAVVSVHAQSSLHGSQWIFGKEAWVDFSADTPVVRRAPRFLTGDPSTSFADAIGRLIWYADGYGVKNAQHNYIYNGMFYDTIFDSNYSYTQGALALPSPEDSTKSYVLFLNGDFALIDHLGDAGNGSIVGPPYLRNWWEGAPWLGTEKMHAIRHGNGRDWWILNVVAYDWVITEHAPVLGVTLLDASGLQPMKTYELDLPMSYGIDWVVGDLKVSPNGSHFVLTGMLEQGVRLMTFDRCSGAPGPAIDSVFLDYPGYSLEFSSSGNIIYIGSGNKLWQWVPRIGQSDSSLTLIASVPPFYWFGGLQRAIDDAIYAASGHLFYPGSGSFEVSMFNSSLSRIAFPDEEGVACSFQPGILDLDSGVSTWGLPNLPNYALGALEGSPCDTLSGGSTAVGAPSPEAAPFLHPNPARREWRLSGLPDGAYEYALFDALGRELLRGTWTGSGPYRIPAADLPRGWYRIRVEREGRPVWRGAALRE